MSVPDRIELDGRTIPLSSLDRVLWPRTGTTKGEMLAYYLEAAPAILPHLQDRPITLTRFPGGVDGKGFFQTRCPPHPEWLRTEPIRQPDGTVSRDYCLLDDAAGLAWAANIAAIELHPLLGRLPRIDHPTVVLFDLDPGPAAGLGALVEAALVLRQVLDHLGLASLVKTSGKGGLHIVVPVDGDHTYARTKPFAQAVARRLTVERPDLITDRSTRRDRGGRVLVDWAQNNEHRSIAAPYSLRALPVPSVSTPLTWSEVEALASTALRPQVLFGPRQVLDRLQLHGELFRPALELQQRLPVLDEAGTT